MITFFTTAKPFKGHNGVIQRNALKSWTLLHPEVEVIVFGDEEGVAEVCAELGLRHERHVERHESGLKYVRYLFEQAQKMARHDYLGYVNCDIILLRDFADAFQRVRSQLAKFLMIGRRWDTEIALPVDFSNEQWELQTRKLALKTGKHQILSFIDYFCFAKGLYPDIPPLVVGRNYWDHWLVWRALTTPVPVIDCSRAVVAVHQNHDYAYSPGGSAGTHGDELAMRNKQLGGNGEYLRSIRNATHIITRGGSILSVPFYDKWVTISEMATRQGFLEHTFWLRKRLGLRKQTLKRPWESWR
jgi:hypothetical protein